MRYLLRSVHRSSLLPLLLLITPICWADDGSVTVNLRLARGLEHVSIELPIGSALSGADRYSPLAAGRYRVHAEEVVAAKTRHRLFIRSLPEAQRTEAEAIAFEWSERGYSPELVDMGHRYLRDGGEVLDNRMIWIAIDSGVTAAEAKSKQRALNEEGHWPWVYPERVDEGSGRIVLVHESGERFTGPAPCRLELINPMRIHEPINGLFGGSVTFRIGDDGGIEIDERIPVDAYLAGVLPSEMPALWPMEALKAQAITARSDVFAHRGMKHGLEGFDFTIDEMSRVYGGEGARHPQTDEAIALTAGVVMVREERIVPGVFSSNCGGWTADNDTVWSAPADGALRNRVDGPSAPSESLASRLRGQSDAYCSGDERYFRWSRTLTTAAVSDSINRRYTVGTVKDIRLGDRGPSGRLKWVEVVGTRGTARIEKEYPIRLAFGGLPSAMFILDRTNGSSGTVYMAQACVNTVPRGWPRREKRRPRFSPTISAAFELRRCGK